MLKIGTHSLAALLIVAMVGRGQEYESAPDWMLPLEPAPDELVQDKQPEVIPPPQNQEARLPDRKPLPATDHVGSEIIEHPCCDCCTPCCNSGPRCWISADFLLWWIKDGPLPPLATILDGTSTSVVIGQTGVDYGTFKGGRASAGRWLGSRKRVGVEASGFLFEDRGNSQAVQVDSTEFLALNVPLSDGTVIPLAFPFFSSGRVSAISHVDFWGAEANALYNLRRGCGCSVDFLAGFRYLELNEDLIYAASSDIPIASTSLSSVDHFGTRNQFFGGQLGARAELIRGRLSGSVTAKVALGINERISSISGFTTSTTLGVATTTPIGIFTGPMNTGVTEDDNFTAIPEFQARIRFAVTTALNVVASYDLIFWPEVFRPGDQIDRSLTPVVLNGKSDFWAQGVSFGLEGRW